MQLFKISCFHNFSPNPIIFIVQAPKKIATTRATIGKRDDHKQAAEQKAGFFGRIDPVGIQLRFFPTVVYIYIATRQKRDSFRSEFSQFMYI